MRRWSQSELPLAVAVALALLAGAPRAWGQFGPGGGMRPMGPGMQPGPQGDQKEEGPAEAAPENQGQEPALQPLPAWPGQRERQLQFFQLDGYFRGRAFLFHDLNLGIPQGPTGPSAPFFIPYSEFGATGNALNPGNPASCAAQNNRACRSQDLTTADIRLRLEPTINVTEQVRVKAQIDVFDNQVFGGTPDGYFLNGQNPPRDVPLQGFSRTQIPPEAGRNSFEDSIRVKRAWAEVRTPIGELRFGRMPSHWGMGMLVNSGDCLDCDFGVNVDRVMFATKFKEHFAAILGDWVATGPTTRFYTPNQSNGPVYNADPIDDVFQVGLALGRQDKPEELKERVERGDLVLNYGGYFVYRWQAWDQITNPGANMTRGALDGQSEAQLTANLTNRGMWAFIPDLWFRLNYKKFHIEAEVAVIGGRIATVSDQLSTVNRPLDILQFGGVLRADYKLLHDALKLGLEIGTASGDQAEDPNALVNFRRAQLVRPAGQTKVSNFIFDPDYHVDLILFRRILGAVTNATYFKAHASYDLIDSLTARIDAIYAVANIPVAYPGNSPHIGIELDGSVMYHNEAEGFYAGVAYGVLFPLGALSIPGTDATGKLIGPGDIYPGFGKEAGAGQTLQVRMVVKF